MKPRGLGRLSCWGHTGKLKARYETREEALEHVGNTRQEPYRCRDCGKWHNRTVRP